MKLSIVIPCYNEEETLEKIFNKVMKFNEFEKEVIIIDDCSNDKTPEIISKLKNNYKELKSERHSENMGKGSALRTGFKIAQGDIILHEKSFGIEPEITMKLAKKKFIFYEVPISYKGRSYSDGKKITIKDAFRAIYCIIRYRFFD